MMRDTCLRPKGRGAAPEALRDLLLVEARPLVRLSLVQALETEWPDVHVRACNAVETVITDTASYSDVRLVLFVAGAALCSNPESIEGLQAMVNALPSTPVVVLSDGDTGADARAAVKCGARGYVSTHADLPVLIQSICLVMVGGSVIPTSVLDERSDESRAPNHGGITGSADSRVRGDVIDIFTPKETEVLRYLNLGKPNKIIAYELNICETTVKVHIRHIMRKLGATNRTHAAILARDLCDGIGGD